MPIVLSESGAKNLVWEWCLITGKYWFIGRKGVESLVFGTCLKCFRFKGWCVEYGCNICLCLVCHLAFIPRVAVVVKFSLQNFVNIFPQIFLVHRFFRT